MRFRFRLYRQEFYTVEYVESVSLTVKEAYRLLAEKRRSCRFDYWLEVV